jgi:hypothetical protein
LYRWVEEHSQLYTFFREKAAGWVKGLVRLRGGWKSGREASAEEKQDRAQLTVALLQEIRDLLAQRRGTPDEPSS